MPVFATACTDLRRQFLASHRPSLAPSVLTCCSAVSLLTAWPVPVPKTLYCTLPAVPKAVLCGRVRCSWIVGLGGAAVAVACVAPRAASVHVLRDV